MYIRAPPMGCFCLFQAYPSELATGSSSSFIYFCIFIFRYSIHRCIHTYTYICTTDHIPPLGCFSPFQAYPSGLATGSSSSLRERSNPSAWLPGE